MEEQKDKFKIEKGFQFKIEIKGLDEEREYNVSLYSPRNKQKFDAVITRKEEEPTTIIAVWQPEVTSQMPISSYTLDIYDKEKSNIIEYEDFAMTSNNSLSM
jgi:hypothetical protein